MAMAWGRTRREAKTPSEKRIRPEAGEEPGSFVREPDEDEREEGAGDEGGKEGLGGLDGELFFRGERDLTQRRIISVAAAATLRMAATSQ